MLSVEGEARRQDVDVVRLAVLVGEPDRLADRGHLDPRLELEPVLVDLTRSTVAEPFGGDGRRRPPVGSSVTTAGLTVGEQASGISTRPFTSPAFGRRRGQGQQGRPSPGIATWGVPSGSKLVEAGSRRAGLLLRFNLNSPIVSMLESVRQ